MSKPVGQGFFYDMLRDEEQQVGDSTEEIKLEPEDMHVDDTLEDNDLAMQSLPVPLDLPHPQPTADKFVELSSSGAQLRPLPTSLNDDDDVISQFNYGSEWESSASEDEEDALPILSRAQRVHMDTHETDGPAAQEVSAAPSTDDIYEPNRLFHFVWKSFPNPPIRPELRRETFSSSNVGPTNPCVDPYEIFVSIWDRQMMEHIASETNRYAQEVAQQLIFTDRLGPSSRINNWQDTSVDELYVFFAMLLGMGIVVKSTIDDYWSAKSGLLLTPGFGTLMSLNRFKLLAKCLHFNNNRDMRVQELRPSEAKLYKLAPVVSHLNNRFQAMYNLGQNIALDESLLQWKGWLSINQFIPNKAAAVGIKTYEVCESQTGYLWRFEIHAHQSDASELQPHDVLAAHTPATVLRLLQGLEHKGHTVWMDNFYNSPALARKLKTLGFDNVGTLRTNRQFVPQQLNDLTKTDMRVGQITGYTSGDVDLMVWRASNRVAMLSTYHGNAIVNVDGNRKPSLVSDYNTMMGGVDKKDQMLAMFPMERKRTRIWYKKFFRRLLNVSVLNSFIIHKSSSSSSSALQHRAFRIKLIDSLIQKHSSAFVPKPQSKPHNLFGHYLAENLLSACGGRSRRTCVGCRKRAGLHCVGCNKPCCLACFPVLHGHL